MELEFDNLAEVTRDWDSVEGAFSVTACLDAAEPAVFWRDRWHWPWWSAAEFDRRLRELVDSIERVGAAEQTLAYVERPHPACWLMQLAALRLGRRVVALADTAASAERGQRGQAEDVPESSVPSSVLLCEPLAEPVSLVPQEHSAVTTPSGWASTSAQLETEVEAIGEGWRTGRALAPKRRPVLLLPAGAAQRSHCVAALWGSRSRAAWLFGESGEHWLQDLLWARPHVAWAGRREARALVAELSACEGRRFRRGALRTRRLRHGLRRLRVLVCTDPQDESAAQLELRMRAFPVVLVRAARVSEMASP